jgi:hypothetical protein
VATIKADAEAAADLRHDPSMSLAVNEGARAEIRARTRLSVLILGSVATIVLVMAALWVPNLIDWDRSPASTPSGSPSPVRGR